MAPSEENASCIEDMYEIPLEVGETVPERSSDETIGAVPSEQQLMEIFAGAREIRYHKWKLQPWGIEPLAWILFSIRLDYKWACRVDKKLQANGQTLRSLKMKEARESWNAFAAKHERPIFVPFLSFVLLVTCTATMIFEFAYSNWTFAPLKENPTFGPSAESLAQVGALSSPKLIEDGEWFRVIISIFMHAGVLHFFLSMPYLVVVAMVERNIGSLRVSSVFFLSALGANILSALYSPRGTVIVGVSGGLYSIIGLCIADIMWNWKCIRMALAMNTSDPLSLFWVKACIVLQLVAIFIVGTIPFIDNFVHLGGFLYGWLCGLGSSQTSCVRLFNKKECGFSWQRMLVRATAIGVAVFCLAMSSLQLWHLDEQKAPPFPWLRHLSCIEFPPTNPWWKCNECSGIIEGTIYQNPGSAHGELGLVCPSGRNVTIPLVSKDNFTDDGLRDQLRSFCELFCLNIDEMDSSFHQINS